MKMDTAQREQLTAERYQILAHLERWLEPPMVVLGFVWLALFIYDMTRGLTPWLRAFSTLIWIIFILDFLLKFIVAPKKIPFLKHNWLTIIALALPALRVLSVVRAVRILGAARVGSGANLLRVVTSINRSMGALSSALRRRGFGYIVGLTFIVNLAGAAGMYAFENQVPDPSGIHSYGTAVWWTAMVLTTMGSDYFPKTAAGRTLCWLLAVFAFAVFGYVTATLATYFVGRDAESDESDIASQKAIEALRSEIAALRSEIQSLSQRRAE